MPAFFHTLEKVKPVYDWAYKIMLFICKLLLIGDIIITSVVVAGRYFLSLQLRTGVRKWS